MKGSPGIVVVENVVLEGEGSTVAKVLRENPEMFDLTPEAALASETTALAARERSNCVGSTWRRWKVSWNSCALCNNNVESIYSSCDGRGKGRKRGQIYF